MTEKGSFIFNGIERVVVSQLQRSPGVFFRPGDVKGIYIGKIIPYRGAWVEFEYDSKNLLYVRLDRKKKFLASVFMRAIVQMKIFFAFFIPLINLFPKMENYIGKYQKV